MTLTPTFRRLLPLLVGAWLSACSSLPQNGPDMRDAERVSAEQNIVFTSLSPESVSAFVKKPEADKPLSAALSSGEVQLRLGPGDVLRVQMFETGTTGTLFSGTEGAGVLNQVVIDAQGNITLPYAGRLRAAGVTPAQLQQRIADRLRPIAVEPAAFVQVMRDHSNSIMVAGAVPKAGRQSLRDGIAGALDAVNNAGGIAGPPWHYDLVLRRDGQVSRRTVADLLNGGDFALMPGDRLLVEHRPKRFVALGALQAAGAFEFPSPDLTLLGALATARGLSDQRADRTGVYVFRPVREGRPQAQLFLLNMERPDSLFVADAFAIEPDDAIYVSNAPLTDVNKILEPILRSLSIFNFATSVGQ